MHLEQLVDWVRVILVHINLFHHRELDACSDTDQLRHSGSLAPNLLTNVRIVAEHPLS